MKKTLKSLRFYVNKICNDLHLQLQEVGSDTYFNSEKQPDFISITYKVDRSNLLIKIATNCGIFDITGHTSSINTLSKLVELDRALWKVRAE